MTAEFRVRRATLDDASQLLALRRALSAESKYMLLEPGELTDTIDDQRKRIAAFDDCANGLLLVAEEAGALIGMLRAAGGSARRLRHSTTLALGVSKDHWGKGVARAMLGEALEWSKRAGLRRVELTVHTTNARAVALYERLGFQVEGVRRSSLFVDGVYEDEYLMSIINDV